MASLLRSHLEALEATFTGLRGASAAISESEARRFALALAAVAAAFPLAEQGAWALSAGRGPRSALAARRFVAERIPAAPDPARSAARLAESLELSGLG
jgi:hypothetical protein